MIASESKKIILSIICIAVLIIAFVGVSYAAFTTVLTDSNSNGLSTGTISLILDNQGEAIFMKNSMPISDEEGKQLSGDGNVYDFSVQTVLAPNTTINYEISAEKINSESNELVLDNQSVKLYLQKLESNGYVDTAITKVPQPFTPLDSDSFLGSKMGSMVLYSGTFSNTTDQSKEIQEAFRLRFWVDKNAIIDSVSREFNIKLNVTAKAI